VVVEIPQKPCPSRRLSSSVSVTACGRRPPLIFFLPFPSWRCLMIISSMAFSLSLFTSAAKTSLTHLSPATPFLARLRNPLYFPWRAPVDNPLGLFMPPPFSPSRFVGPRRRPFPAFSLHGCDFSASQLSGFQPLPFSSYCLLLGPRYPFSQQGSPRLLISRFLHARRTNSFALATWRRKRPRMITRGGETSSLAPQISSPPSFPWGSPARRPPP